jgi:hypothetical protein
LGGAGPERALFGAQAAHEVLALASADVHGEIDEVEGGIIPCQVQAVHVIVEQALRHGVGALQGAGAGAQQVGIGLDPDCDHALGVFAVVEKALLGIALDRTRREQVGDAADQGR